VLALALAAALAVPDPALAVRTTYWTVTTSKDFGDGTLEKVSVEEPGGVLLSPRHEPLGGAGALYGWSLARDASGAVFLGTGDEGKIYRIREGAEPEEWYDTIEMEILALAADGKGRLYAGGSPDGTIYRITGKNEGATFVDTPENYIWALAVDDAGNVYAATGPRGLIYKIDPGGNAQVFFDAHDKNVLSLVYDVERRALIAGTEGRGLVIEIGMDGRGRVHSIPGTRKSARSRSPGMGRSTPGAPGPPTAASSRPSRRGAPPKGAARRRRAPISPRGAAGRWRASTRSRARGSCGGSGNRTRSSSTASS
jgi:hypothetical protein